jgi:hypothetical protein
LTYQVNTFLTCSKYGLHRPTNINTFLYFDIKTCAYLIMIETKLRYKYIVLNKSVWHIVRKWNTVWSSTNQDYRFCLYFSEFSIGLLIMKLPVQTVFFFHFIDNDMYICNHCLSTLKFRIRIPTHGEAYSIQHYVIKFVSDLRQVGGFLRVLWFPPPTKLTATI